MMVMILMEAKMNLTGQYRLAVGRIIGDNCGATSGPEDPLVDRGMDLHERSTHSASP